MKHLIWFSFLCLFSILKVEAKIWYLTPNGEGNKNGNNWVNAMSDLQKAMKDAQNGDTIWLAKGTYIPTSSISSNQNNSNGYFFGLTKNLKIFGGFVGTETEFSQRDWENNITILSGDASKNSPLTGNVSNTNNRTDDYRRIFVANGNLSNAELDGVHLRHTYPQGNSNQNVSFNGISMEKTMTGVLLQNVTGLTLRNLIISNHYSHANGGLNILNSTVHIENIIIQHNYAVSSINKFENSKITGSGIIIRNNSSRDNSGGLTLSNDKNSVFYNILFERNHSTDVSMLNLMSTDTIQMDRLVIRQNISNVSSINVNRSKAKISNLLMYQDTTFSEVVGIHIVGNALYPSDLRLANATITKMHSFFNDQKYLIRKDNYNYFSIYNSILFQTENKLAYDLINGGLNESKNNLFKYSIHATESENNLVSTINPFVDYSNNNFMLSIGSIGRNAGDSSLLKNVINASNLVQQTDALGRPRVNNSGNIDIGAIEDTLIDALLRNRKFSFEVALDKTSILLNTTVTDHQFKAITIKGGRNPHELTYSRNIDISQWNEYKNVFQLYDTQLQYFELWGEYPNGEIEFLKKVQLRRDQQFNINAFPTIVQDQITVIVEGGGTGIINLFNINGQFIKRFEVDARSSKHTLNTSNLQRGTYLLQLEKDQIKQNIKFIKK